MPRLNTCSSGHPEICYIVDENVECPICTWGNKSHLYHYEIENKLRNIIGKLISPNPPEGKELQDMLHKVHEV